MNKLATVSIGNTLLGTTGSSSTFQSLTGVAALVSIFLKIAFVLAGLILLFYFILGGIGMISSAGKNDPKAAEQAKATITSAVIGFIVVFTAYWIVELIGKLLGIQNLIF
jgi:succinate dehydrogenase/fumarate reductase cytochrome b subunit